jgi:hypothetical protein
MSIKFFVFNTLSGDFLHRTVTWSSSSTSIILDESTSNSLITNGFLVVVVLVVVEVVPSYGDCIVVDFVGTSNKQKNILNNFF